MFKQHCLGHPTQVCGAEPDLAELWYLAENRAGAAPQAAPWLSFAAGTAVAVGSHQDPQKLRMERLCCILWSHCAVGGCDGLGKLMEPALNGTGGTHLRSELGIWLGKNGTACDRRRQPLQHEVSLESKASCGRPGENKSCSTSTDFPGSA